MSDLEDIWHDEDGPRVTASLKRENDRLRRRVNALEELLKPFVKDEALGRDLANAIIKAGK
jgi:hypothetical protein